MSIMTLNNTLKYGILSAFGLLLNTSIGMANSGSCSLNSHGDCSSVTQVIEGISWEIIGLPQTHQAGDRLQFDLVLHKKVNLEGWHCDGIFLKSQIGETFFFEILRTEELKSFFYSPQETQVFHIDEMVKEHIGGEVSLRLYTGLQRYISSWEACGVNLDLASFQINSDHVDLEPPAVIGIRYSKEFYQPGEAVTAYVEFSEELKDLETNHITFKNERDDFPEYSKLGFQLHRTTKDGYEYAVEFDLKKQVSPGEYFLRTFNRQDIFGNFVSDVKAENLPPLVLRGE